MTAGEDAGGLAGVGPAEGGPGHPFLGVVLAGGESRRFGRNKALFPVGGRPMARWALEALGPHFSHPVVVANDPDVALALGVQGRGDRIPGLGPLGGLLTALEWAEEDGREGIFLLGADLPLVGPALVGRILSAWPPDAPAVVPGSHGPLGFEPLCAGYRVECLPAVKEAVRLGRRSMEEALDRLGAYRIPPGGLGPPEELEVAFTNVNTLEDAGSAEVLLSGSSGFGVGNPPERGKGP